MKGSVELTVTGLALVQLGTDAQAVRVTAGDEKTGDLVSIAVHTGDAPPIGALITVRIEQADPADPEPAGVLSTDGATP